ncbi:diguanylate cyclase [Novosphingobium sp. 1949]|uniref:diguanylate cyclase n=1 Tax=Novosphingobium organovorum TaxID=2930092 RepID=A0ABT0BD08_9SPHN|nr:sensor domain-containing diguanylate cyclase [Novosphingobium organovorum]MCJ2182775.1 diguanylate cyclase [Novosphingobium organovorum]
MRSDTPLFNHKALWPILVASTYFLCAVAALHLTDGSDGLATVWPASGVSIAGLLLARKAQRPLLVGAIALASLGGNWLSGMPALDSLFYTIANVAEAVIGFLCIRHINRHGQSIYNPLAVLEFAVAAMLTGVLSAATAALLTGAGLGLMFVSWATTVTLGIMIVVPLTLNIFTEFKGLSTIPRKQWLLSGLVLLAVALISLVVFNQTTYPLLFLPLMCVIVATYLLGPNGAMVSILLIAVIGSSKTLGAESGPILLMRHSDPALATLFLQFYLFTLLLSALPLAALLGARERILMQVTRAKRWLEMSEQFAHVGHWRLDLVNNDLFWSDEVFRIHELDSSQSPPLEGALDFYHPDDRALVQRQLEALIESTRPFDFEARLITARGEKRYVRSQGELEFDAKGKPIAIFGIFQDVTERALATLRLAEARQLAEEQADFAMVLAQTDPLTGIANRRNALGTLEMELKKARENQTPLSVAILDIDHFKTINDQFGHAIGDTVIRKVAELCTRMIRNSDLAGRIGGEEFVLVLPGSDAEAARIVGERVRQAIESALWPAPGPEQVTASIGVATLAGATNAQDFLSEADKALYRAKREGRNLLRVAA